ADARNRERIGGIVAAQDGADDVGAGPGGVDQFRGAGRQGDDARWGGGGRPGRAGAQAGGGRQAQDAPPHPAEAVRRPPHRYIRQDRFTNTLEPGVLYPSTCTLSLSSTLFQRTCTPCDLLMS